MFSENEKKKLFDKHLLPTDTPVGSSKVIWIVVTHPFPFLLVNENLGSYFVVGVWVFGYLLTI